VWGKIEKKNAAKSTSAIRRRERESMCVCVYVCVGVCEREIAVWLKGIGCKETR